MEDEKDVEGGGDSFSTHLLSNDSDVPCSTQRKTDGKLAAQMADLQQFAILLGDRVNSMQKQIRLKCDWNITSFCVTPHKYNESAFH